MFRKILYPTDFSDVSYKALDYVKQLRDAGTEEVVVLHVIETRDFSLPEMFPTKELSGWEEKVESWATEEANKVAKTLSDIGLRASVRIEKGIPFTEILRIENEEDISLIVIGSHGKSNVEEMLLGSVSEKVVRKAESPVFVVKR